MGPRLTRLWALIGVLLVLQLASVNAVRIHKRQEDGQPPETTAVEAEVTTELEPSGTESITLETSASRTQNEDEDDAPKTTSKPDETTTSDESTETYTSIFTTDGGVNTTYFDFVPDGELPIKPEITPGWGVAGSIMMMSGIIYTLVGIKNRWINTFLSTSYLTSLSVTVLIVYVMNVPVSNALQGGYVAAAVISGIVLGAGSMFFKELTEGLGCALGGFCISMWLLTLVPGGLLEPVASKAIFIACFTLVGFAFYFSHYTRDWALILMISFAGSTITILGIDCFSRAGLKEFWVYVWQLNKNLFPLGTDTYPVTKGIRVETAAIIIVFLFGIVSQIKLWRIVREKKAKRAAERAEGARNLEEEEENVGRQIEEQTARDRQEWERAYGSGEGSSSTSRNSMEKAKDRESHNGSTETTEAVEVIEMANMSESGDHKESDALEQDQNGKVTVRVVEDGYPEDHSSDSEVVDEKAAAERPHSQATNRVVSGEKKEKRRQSDNLSVNEPPQVVPLPFTVPQEDVSRPASQCSSVATFADEDELRNAPARDTLAKRLSRGSGKILRSFSQKSAHNPRHGLPSEGESGEELVMHESHPDDDDDGDDDESLVATLDDASISGAMTESIEIDAKLASSDKSQAADDAPAAAEEEVHQEEDGEPSKDKQGQGVATDVVQNDTAEEQDSRRTSKFETVDDDNAITNQTSNGGAGLAEKEAKSFSGKAKSVASAVSTPASLTKDRLPRSLSRVAMSYRTNEWAKHLSQADTPAPDDLRPAEQPSNRSQKERPTPLDIEDLQKGIKDGAPSPRLTRSNSRASLSRQGPPKRNSLSGTSPVTASPQMVPSPDRESFVGAAMSPPTTSAVVAPPVQIPMSRSGSAIGMRRTSATIQPIAEEQSQMGDEAPIAEEVVTAAPLSPSASYGEPNRQRTSVPGVVSFSSPQTLLGQREVFLRNKSQGNLVSDTPEPTFANNRASADAGSLNDYPMYAAALAADPDDMPLSQRRSMMLRGNSYMSLSGTHPQQRQSPPLQQQYQSQPLPRSNSVVNVAADNTNFNSHQPKRVSTLPTQAARQSQLASFRNSVAADLRGVGTPTGRETPFASTTNLLGGGNGRESADVQRNIDLQRNHLLGQKEAEAQRKEWIRQQKEWNDRAFDEQMRSGHLMDAHREAMRRMQSSAKDS